MSSSSSSPGADPALARLGNLAGAWALALSDRVTSAAAAAAGRGGQAPAALVALDQFAEGSTIERLSQVLGLTHSAAVRLIDALVVDGHVVRSHRAGDRRSVALRLTPAGQATAQRVARARAAALQEAITGLSDDQRLALTGLAEQLTADLAALRLEQRAAGEPPAGGWLCRLCDFRACGRLEGRCPAAARARRGWPPR